ncbi:substrate-binding domain-containing protein [Candidatus Aerophobetes bacterium]|nr:substrate-binding domain-containing protein [Candidatus Aerophobetes bacterium]
MKAIKSKRCISIAVAIVLAAMLFVVGAGRAEAELGEGLNFVFVNAGDPANPFHAKIVKGWKEAVSALKVKATINFAYGDVSKSLDYIDVAIGLGIDGIYIFSLDPDGVHPYIEEALEKGIAVVLSSSRDPVYGPDQVPFIGYGLVEQGYTLGTYLARQLEDGAHIALFAEFIAPYSDLRRQGILQAIDDAGLTYTAPDNFECGEDLARAVDIIKTYLIAHPETDAIIGLGSVTTPSGTVALQDLRYEPGKVKWVGFDLLPETVEGIKLGYGASNVDEVFNFGFNACIALYLKAKYDFVVGDMPVATAMVDKDTIEGFEYWVEKGIK